MSGEHAEIALHAGDINLIDFAGEGEFFRRDEIEVKGGHGVLANGEWRMANDTLSVVAPPIRYSLFAIRYSLELTPLRRRASCPFRPPLRWCRPCRRRPPADG